MPFQNAQTELPLEKRTFFYIPVHKYPRFLQQIEKLSKRSEKNGGYKIECLVFGTMEDPATGERRYEVYLEAPEVIIEGWQFVARLDHSNETGNVIRMLPNIEGDIPVAYRTVAPNCDHCQVNRLRRDTFVLRNTTTGEYKQVGSTCLADLFQTDPREVAKFAEIMTYAREAAEGNEQDDTEQPTRSGLRNLKCIDLEEYLAACAAVIRRDGRYKPSSFREEATKWAAIDTYFRRDIEITPEDRDTVAEAMTWIDALAARRDAGENLNGYEHNVLVIGEATMIEGRSIGLAASIIGCYKRNLAPKVTFKPEPKPEPLVLDNMQGILDLFEKAGSKIKYPKITISFEDVGDIVISRAGPAAQYPGSINVTSPGGYGNNTWYGRLHRDGRWEANRRVPTAEALTKALLAFAADPAGVAAAYGHKSGNCCFCHKGLTDERSAHVGYGATCAANYQLPYPTIKEMKAIKADACSHDHKEHAHA